MVKRYQWEALLFIGIPFFMLVIGLLLSSFPASFFSDPPDILFLSFGWLGSFLLGGFYLLVRRMGRPLLSLVSAYAFAESIIIGIVAVFIHMIGAGVDWWWFALTSMVVLIWFAGRVSRLSFGHALLLIGLSPVLLGPTSIIPPMIGYTGASEPSVLWSLDGWFLLRDWLPYLIGVAHILYAVWLLAHVDSVGRVPKTAIVALFAMAGATQLASELSDAAFAFVFRGPDIDVVFDEFSHMYGELGYWIVWYAVVTLIVYRYDLVVNTLRRYWDRLHDELRVGSPNGRNDA